MKTPKKTETVDQSFATAACLIPFWNWRGRGSFQYHCIFSPLEDITPFEALEIQKHFQGEKMKWGPHLSRRFKVENLETERD